MGLLFFFVLAAAETVYLLLHVLRVRSAPVEAILFGYSAGRLMLILFVFLTLILFLYLLLQSLRRARGQDTLFDPLLETEKWAWFGIFSALIFALILFLLLVQEAPFFGRFYPIYIRIRPIVLWLLLIAVQAVAFLLVWVGLRFTHAFKPKIGAERRKSVVVLLAIFLLLVVVKLLLITPHSHGLIKRYGESKYILMAQVFTEGVTLSGYNNPVIFHYPFLYPILLSFPWRFQNHAFTAIKVLNTVLTASAVFPVFLIAKQMLGRRSALWAAFLSALLPFQFLIPLQVLSENLYIPLFLWTVFLIFASPRRHCARLPWDILTGLFIGMLYLTRYITLAVIPFFLLLWWIKPFGKIRRVLAFPPRKILHLCLMVLIIIALYIPWIFFARAAGLTFQQALGFGITAKTDPRQLTLRNLFTWILLYLAYFVLLLAPFLGLISRLNSRMRRKPFVKHWLWVVGILSFAFLIAIVRHSWRAGYNAQLPTRIMGRYIIFLPPLFLITALLPLSVKQKPALTVRVTDFIPAVFLPLALVLFSYLLLIEESIIPVRAGLVGAFGAYDVFYIQLLGPWFWLLLVLIYLLPPILLRFWKSKHVLQTIVLLLSGFYLLAVPAYIDFIETQQSYEQLGSRIVDMIRVYGLGEDMRYQVFLPDTIDPARRTDIAWALRVHHLAPELAVTSYPSDQVPDTGKDAIILVRNANENPQFTPSSPFAVLFEERFTIQLLQPGRTCP